MMSGGRGKWSGIAFVCVVLSVIPGCSKQAEKINRVDETIKDTVLEQVVRQEAMLVNIPLPLYDERIMPPVEYNVGEYDTRFFGYKSSLSIAHLSDFFLTQMERYGWEHVVSFEAGDVILQFSNPHEYCTIILRPGGDGRSLVYLYIKRASFIISSPLGSELG